MNQSPYLFIVGCTRSGTTLLQRMLDHHPLLAVANEPRFLLRIVENGIREANPALNPDLIEWVRSHDRLHKLGLSDTAVDKAAENSLTYREFVSALYAEYGKLNGKVIAGEKTPQYVMFLPRLHALFPWVRSIHLIRDGRDVALSTLQWREDKGSRRFPLWREQPVAVCALSWCRAVKTGRADGNDLGAERYREVKYEDLVNRPEQTLRDITEFLKLPFASEMLASHERRGLSDSKLSAKKAWLPPIPGLRDWRRQMPERDVELFEALAGDLLSTLGYERAFNNISSEVAKVAEECQNRWETEMIRRHGKGAS